MKTLALALWRLTQWAILLLTVAVLVNLAGCGGGDIDDGAEEAPPDLHGSATVCLQKQTAPGQPARTASCGGGK